MPHLQVDILEEEAVAVEGVVIEEEEALAGVEAEVEVEVEAEMESNLIFKDVQEIGGESYSICGTDLVQGGFFGF